MRASKNESLGEEKVRNVLISKRGSLEDWKKSKEEAKSSS